MNIRRLIMEELKEVRTTQKTKYGQGIEHKIYPSQKFPDRLLKIGEKEIVEEWVKIFQSDLNIFPRIFRVGKVTNYKHNDSDVYFVEIEKLNTSKVEKEWDYIHDKMEEIGIIDSEDDSYGRDITDIYTNHGHDQKAITDIAEKLKNYDKSSYELFLKYFKLFKDCERAIEKIVGHESLVDAHKYNFGYSKDGKLKCLDI